MKESNDSSDLLDLIVRSNSQGGVGPGSGGGMPGSPRQLTTPPVSAAYQFISPIPSPALSGIKSQQQHHNQPHNIPDGRKVSHSPQLSTPPLPTSGEPQHHHTSPHHMLKNKLTQDFSSLKSEVKDSPSSSSSSHRSSTVSHQEKTMSTTTSHHSSSSNHQMPFKKETATSEDRSAPPPPPPPGHEMRIPPIKIRTTDFDRSWSVERVPFPSERTSDSSSSSSHSSSSHHKSSRSSSERGHERSHHERSHERSHHDRGHHERSHERKHERNHHERGHDRDHRHERNHEQHRAQDQLHHPTPPQPPPHHEQRVNDRSPAMQYQVLTPSSTADSRPSPGYPTVLEPTPTSMYQGGGSNQETVITANAMTTSPAAVPTTAANDSSRPPLLPSFYSDSLASSAKASPSTNDQPVSSPASGKWDMQQNPPPLRQLSEPSPSAASASISVIDSSPPSSLPTQSIPAAVSTIVTKTTAIATTTPAAVAVTSTASTRPVSTSFLLGKNRPTGALFSGARPVGALFQKDPTSPSATKPDPPKSQPQVPDPVGEIFSSLLAFRRPADRHRSASHEASGKGKSLAENNPASTKRDSPQGATQVGFFLSCLHTLLLQTPCV